MKRKWSSILATGISLILFFTIALPSALAGHHHAKEKKIGILLTAFGSSEASAQVSFENIGKKTRAAYPDVPVFWAYTSHIIRTKLAKEGKVLDSPRVALAKMADRGFTHVVVQSLHTILGAEYEDLKQVVDGYKTMGAFDSIIIGNPLLATQADMEETVDAILSVIPRERKKNEAVILMGHGTHHPANAFYAALMFQVQLKDPNVFIGTVEGYPELGDIQALLKERNLKTAWLMPFMSVAGDHAKNDMAGNGEDSWKSILVKSGIKCNTVLKGTAEFDAFVDIWVSHIQAPLAHFK